MAYSTLPMQHRLFYTELDFLPITTLDGRGRPWVSILVGPSGQPGFISSPDESTLQIVSLTWQGDPIRSNLVNQTDPKREQRVAAVGVMTENRRRNKVAGVTKAVGFMDNFLAMQIGVKEALGNCPKYIPVRKLEPHPAAMPSLESEDDTLLDNDTLPDSVCDFVITRDALFLGSTHDTHLGCNIRGGANGFVRVTKDKRTLVIPDFSGNRFMQSYGNIFESKKAGVVFPDFETGDILYLTGEAEILFDDEAKAVMPRISRLLMLRVTGYSFVRNALPFQTVKGSYEPSPYTPPIRYLLEEGKVDQAENTSAALTTVQMHSPDLATFTFALSKPVKHVAGQYGIFDMSNFLGEIGYAHMRTGDEKFVNEDGIRTWTLSSAPSLGNNEKSDTVQISVRRVERGRVTSRLFSYAARRLALDDVEPEKRFASLTVPFLGTGGTFTLPSTPKKVLFIAGGIGITPFLSMLSSFDDRTRASREGWDVVLWTATREPDLIKQLVDDRAVARAPLSDLKLFSSEPANEASEVTVNGRITDWIASDAFSAHVEDITKREVYVCGPPEFENAVLAQLQAKGINTVDVRRESFSF